MSVCLCSRTGCIQAHCINARVFYAFSLNVLNEQHLSWRPSRSTKGRFFLLFFLSTIDLNIVSVLSMRHELFRILSLFYTYSLSLSLSLSHTLSPCFLHDTLPFRLLSKHFKQSLRIVLPTILFPFPFHLFFHSSFLSFSSYAQTLFRFLCRMLRYLYICIYIYIYIKIQKIIYKMIL